MGLRHLCQLAIRLEKALQRRGTGFDDLEPALQIAADLRIDARHLDSRIETSRNGFDGSKGIAQFVAEHTDQPLPGLAFLFAECPANVRQHYQSVGDAVLSKGTPA